MISCKFYEIAGTGSLAGSESESSRLAEQIFKILSFQISNVVFESVLINEIDISYSNFKNPSTEALLLLLKYLFTLTSSIPRSLRFANVRVFTNTFKIKIMLLAEHNDSFNTPLIKITPVLPNNHIIGSHCLFIQY